MNRTSKTAVTLVEIMIAIVVLVICTIPTIGLFNLGYESATLSEDRIYAETLASRIIEVWNGQPFESLAEIVGKPQTDVVERVYNTDKVQDWFTKLPEYARNMGFAQNYFKGQLDVVEVDRGLLSLEVSVQWTVVEGAKKGETRQFRLITLRAREDISVDSSEGSELNSR